MMGAMRPMLLAASLLTLTSCVTPEQQAAIQAQNEAQDDSYCRSLSARPGSDAYVNCRLVQQQQRQGAAAIEQQRRAALGQAMNQALNPPRAAPRTCQSMPNVFGGYNTSCY